MADGLTSFYGGFVIFAVVGFMAKEAGVSVTDMATQGKNRLGSKGLLYDSYTKPKWLVFLNLNFTNLSQSSF